MLCLRAWRRHRRIPASDCFDAATEQVEPARQVMVCTSAEATPGGLCRARAHNWTGRNHPAATRRRLCASVLRGRLGLNLPGTLPSSPTCSRGGVVAYYLLACASPGSVAPCPAAGAPAPAAAAALPPAAPAALAADQGSPPLTITAIAGRPSATTLDSQGSDRTRAAGGPSPPRRLAAARGTHSGAATPGPI